MLIVDRTRSLAHVSAALLSTALALAGCGGIASDKVDSCHGALHWMSDTPGNYDFVICGGDHVANGVGQIDTAADASQAPKFHVGVLASHVTGTGSVACDNATIITVGDPSVVDANNNPLSLSTLAGGNCTLDTTLLDAHHWSASATGSVIGLDCTTSTHCGMELHDFTVSWTLAD